jgi:ribA/ribD-fused uncharacterized protein
MKETNTHIYFWGSIFSQWAKTTFMEGSVKFSSAEQYMMYHKACLFGDTAVANKILQTQDPKMQKSLGRQVKGFNEAKWNEHKLSIVIKGNTLKFSQDEKLKQQLLKTYPKTLVEGSPYDKVWGVGLKYDDPKILSEANWQGQNLLGAALMTVREQLKISSN